MALLRGTGECDGVRLSDRIGIVQPLALAVATGGGGGGDYGITQGGKISVRL